MASTARPVRSRNQPSRNKDNIELNMQLIERLEGNKVRLINIQGNKSTNNSTTNYPKLLATFVNSVNQNYRAYITKKQKQKKDQSVNKTKPVQDPDNQQWKAEKQKKKAHLNSVPKTSLKPNQGFIAQQSITLQKINSQQMKNSRVHKNALGIQPTNSQQTGKNQLKQIKKVVVLTPPPSASYSPNKPFKRSSFHIGIAYTIYMHQIKQKNPNAPLEVSICDPTIHAKRLKMSQVEN